MPSFREPYEEPVDIGYERRPEGLFRTRSVSVKPHRRHELKLLAQGIPLVYCGGAKGHARSEPAELSEERLATLQKLRPLWATNDGKYNGRYDGFGDRADRMARKYGISLAGGK